MLTSATFSTKTATRGTKLTERKVRRLKLGDLAHLDLSFSSFLAIFDLVLILEFEHWMATEHSLVCVGLKDDFEMLLSEIGEHDCNTFAHSFHQLDFDIQHCTKICITYFVVENLEMCSSMPVYR